MITHICSLIPPVLLLFLLFKPLCAAEPRQTKRVLVLYSEDRTHPAHELTDRGIRAIFKSNTVFDVEVYAENLDAARLGGISRDRATADHLRAKYSGIDLHAIITVYAHALNFLLADRGTLFPEVPIVAAVLPRGYGEELKRSPSRPFVTATIAAADISGTIETALRIKPKTKRAALVAGTAASDRYPELTFRRGLKAYEGKIEVIDLTKLPMQETLARVGSLPPDTIVLYASILRDGANQTFVPREALSLVSAAANRPVFGLYDSYMGYGIVGGRLVSFEEQGREAATLALRILAGESPASIPFGGEQTYVNLYDWRELKRWGISEKALPPGSVLRFKSLSLWEEHRGVILGGMSFVILETLLIVALFANLRKRRRAEAEADASALRYRTVADYTYDWEYWSAPDGTINYVSPSCERITGYSVREFMDNPALFTEILLPEDRGRWEDHGHDVHNSAKGGKIQFRIRTKGGDTRWIDHACLPVHDGQGKFLGTRASNRDISDRKKAEFDAQQQRNELAHVSRLAALGELTSAIAHEINQPLAAIRNYANAAQRFLSRSEPDLGRAREALEGIVRDDRRAAEVISGVRELMKKEEPLYHPVQINEVLQEAFGIVSGDALLKGLTIETELAPALPVVTGNRVQLQQVVLNLVLNAADAMNKVESVLRKLVVKTESDGHGGVMVSVRDFGPGIDEAHRDNLFKSFFTTKPKGMGMGLAISQRIIHAHGGSIWAENHPRGGATFCFRLPTSEEYRRGKGEIRRNRDMEI